MRKGFVLLVLYLGSLVAILFLSAGEVHWPMAWATLGVYILISVVNFFLVEPGLVEERSQITTGVRREDAWIASLSFLFFTPFTLAVAGLDIKRFGWTPPLPILVQLMALLVYALGNGLGSWAMMSNKFFSTFVRIQEDRGQAVVAEGPYRFIRHPGYAGTIVAAIALPFSIGSLWALIPAIMGACGFVVRTMLEDRILMEELDGYGEYAQRVRYRLIPGIW